MKLVIFFSSDIAIGAFLSNDAVLLYGKPVIELDAWVEIGVPGTSGSSMINRDSKDIIIATCFRFTNIDTHSMSK